MAFSLDSWLQLIIINGSLCLSVVLHKGGSLIYLFFVLVSLSLSSGFGPLLPISIAWGKNNKRCIFFSLA